MAKRYNRRNWVDAPSTNTPRNAHNLNWMDKGIDDLDNAIEDVQGQINQLVISGDSSVEAAQARVATDQTFETLKERLDNSDSQLAEKASQVDLGVTNTHVSENTNAIEANTSSIAAHTSQIASLASGSPKGTYATITALTTAFPTGNSNIYIVTADGKWYYWNGAAWTAGGTYQSTGIGNGTVNYTSLAPNAPEEIVSKGSVMLNPVQLTYTGSGQGGATYSNRVLTIPSGAVGATSYVGADLYVEDEVVTGAKTVRIYEILNISANSSVTYGKFTFTAWKHVNSSLVPVTVTTNRVPLTSTLCMYWCDYTFAGDETYIKTRLNLDVTGYREVDVTIELLPDVMYALISNTTKSNNTATIEYILGKYVKTDDIKATNDVSLAWNDNEGTVTYTLESGEQLIVEIAQSYNTGHKFYGSVNDVNTPISVTNLITGSTHKEIYHPGVYQVNSNEFTTVICSRVDSTGLNTGKFFSTVRRLKNYEKPSQISHRYGYPLYPLQTVTNIMSVANKKIFGTDNGKLIGTINDNGIIKLIQSDTNYTNFVELSTVPDETDHPLHFEKMGDGNFIMICKTGKVYKITNYSTYTQVMDMTADITINSVTSKTSYLYAYGGFPQLCVYGNIVLISEYIQPSIYTNSISITGGGKIWLSTDYGSMYTCIYDIAVNRNSAATNTHIHSVTYDQYESIIWIVVGDGLGMQSIEYSMDMGATWNLATSINQSAIQCTAIYPLPDCVLFGTDSRVVGVVRYNRPECGTLAGIQMQFDMPFMIEEQFNLVSGSSVPVAVRGGINEKKNILVFGYFLSESAYTASNSQTFGKCSLWITNGYSFKRIFINSEVITNGITGVYYDAINNKYIARLGLDGNIVTINVSQ